MFNQPCFIRKNTPELREYLKELGYKKAGIPLLDIDNSYIVAEDTVFYETYWISEAHRLSIIDCGANEDLFKAIAALRDDSDYMQWFVCDEEDDVSNKGAFVVCRYDKLHSSNYHKATIKELIEHFKQKEL